MTPLLFKRKWKDGVDVGRVKCPACLSFLFETWLSPETEKEKHGLGYASGKRKVTVTIGKWTGLK